MGILLDVTQQLAQQELTVPKPSRLQRLAKAEEQQGRMCAKQKAVCMELSDLQAALHADKNTNMHTHTCI